MCIIIRDAKNDVFKAFRNAFSSHLCKSSDSPTISQNASINTRQANKGRKKYTNFYTQYRYKLKWGDSNPTAIHNWQTFRYCLYQTPDIRLKTALPGKQTPVNSHPSSSHFWADTHISLLLNWWIVFRRNERKHFRRTVPGKQGRS